MDTPADPAPTLCSALAAVSDAAVDQARDLAVAQLDRWAGALHDRLSSTPAQSPSATDTPGDLHPAIVGALIGATVAWVVTRRRTES